MAKRRTLASMQIGRWLPAAQRERLQEEARDRLIALVAQEGLHAVSERFGVLRAHIRDIIEGRIPPGPHLMIDVGVPLYGQRKKSWIPADWETVSMWQAAMIALRALQACRTVLPDEIQALLVPLKKRLAHLRGPYTRKKARQDRWRARRKSAG